MSDFFDIEEGATAPSNSDVMQRMMRIAQEIIDTQDAIDATEEHVSEMKRRLNHLKSVEMPDLMAECGMASFRTESGKVIEIDDFVSGTLPKDSSRRKEALNWLAENGAADIIKTEVSVAFGKNEHNMAKDLSAKLAQEGYFVDEKEGIHPQTLLAFIREKMRSGEEVPLETLGLYAGRVAKVKEGKKGK